MHNRSKTRFWLVRHSAWRWGFRVLPRKGRAGRGHDAGARVALRMSAMQHGQGVSESMGRDLFVVIRFDAFQMDGGVEFKADFVTAKRPVYGRREDAEAEAARLNLQAPKGVHYFVRALVAPRNAP